MRSGELYVISTVFCSDTSINEQAVLNMLKVNKAENIANFLKKMEELLKNINRTLILSIIKFYTAESTN